MNTTASATTPGEVKGFVQQQIPVAADGKVLMTVQVPAQLTECPHLVIAPSIGYSVDGSLRFRGTLALTHTPTGAVLAHSHFESGLGKLAAALKDFNWDFEDREHFGSPENTDMAEAVRNILRDWQISQGFSGTVAVSGEDEEKRAAREREPAATLLREQLNWWSAQYKSIHERGLFKKNQEAWYEAITCSVNGWGMTYLLAVLQRVAPDVADIAARRILAEWDAGDTMGEWVFQWGQELEDGEPLTLSGIPDADPLAQFKADQ